MNDLPKIFIAIDQNDIIKAKTIIERLPPKICGIKVGKELFTSCGPYIIDWIQSKGFKVFLDLKYHDIPNTVEKACFAASKMGVSILNIHALGGKQMMLAAREGVDKAQNDSYLIAVTLLTSMDKKSLNEIGITVPINEQILNLASIASEAKLDGIVCSAKDIEQIKESLPKDFLYVTPGIRLKDDPTDDQKRIATPSDAMRMGSKILIIGRTITQSENPDIVIKQIFDQIS